MKTLLERKISLVVIILQFLVSLLVCIYFGTTGLVPVKYMVAIAVVMVVLLVYQVMSQLTNSSYIFGRVLAVLFCAVFLVGANYVRESMAAFQNVGGATKKVDVISFYVMKDDAAKTLADAKNYSFGILRQQDRENTDKAVQDASKKLNKTLNTVEYDDPLTMVDALYAKEVQAIIMNKSFVDTVKSQYKTFSTDTRELDTSKIESEVEELVDTDVTTKPFNVYISGIDVYGKIGQTSRSDVNIIATVNPVTKKVLLTSTPRDYYVPLYSKGGKSYSGGMPDKLTHAGIYGVDCSINTLEKLYNIDIDYYVRVNFTSLKKIVDLLGGVEVYSDYDFISDWGPHGAGTHYKFKKGYNKVNGKYVNNSYRLLTQVLRNEWGFDGFVMTDWFATGRKYGNSAHAIASGNDLIMPGSAGAVDEIVKAVSKGVILEEDVKRSAANVLRGVLSSRIYQGFTRMYMKK